MRNVVHRAASERRRPEVAGGIAGIVRRRRPSSQAPAADQGELDPVRSL